MDAKQIAVDTNDSRLERYRKLCRAVVWVSGVAAVAGLAASIAYADEQARIPRLLAFYNVLLTVGTTVFSIAFSLLFVFRTDLVNAYFERFRNLSGLVNLRMNRNGQSESSNELWSDRMRGATGITIYGTLSKGWFFTYADHLKDWLGKESKTKLHVGILNPLGNIGRSRFLAASPSEVEAMVKDYDQVLGLLAELLTKYGEKKRVSVSLYDRSGFSLVSVERGSGGYVYFSPYLPTQKSKDAPELTFDRRSEFAWTCEKLLVDLEEAPSTVKLADSRHIHLVNYYLKDMAHRNTILNMPKLDCDFCREYRGLNTAFSFTGHGGRTMNSRIVWENDSFYLIPTMGPILPSNQSHLLINSKHHYTASTQLTEIECHRLREAVEIVKKLLGDNCLFIENGIPTDDPKCNGGCGVTHLHIHALQVPEEFVLDAEKITEFIKESFYSKESIRLDGLGVLTQRLDKSAIHVPNEYLETPYIHVLHENISQVWWASVDGGAGKHAIGFRSQLMRHWAFVVLNEDESKRNPDGWNWKTANSAEDQQRVEMKAENLRSILGSTS